MENASEVGREEKNTPLETYKSFMLGEMKRVLELKQERDLHTKNSKSGYLVESKNYTWLQRVLTKRKEYQEYCKSIEKAIEEATKKKREEEARIQDIDQELSSLPYSWEDINSLKLQIKEIEAAKSFEALGISDPSSAMETLYKNGIIPQFDSFEQAFMLAPNRVGKDVNYMGNAIRENPNYIRFDRTNDESIYREVIEAEISRLELLFEESDDLHLENVLKSFYGMRKELISPKIAPDGKYKVPHKYMFEEIRYNAAEPYESRTYWYTDVDGVYDIDFGKELEQLYENPDILLGIHGRGEDTVLEDKVFREGLENSHNDPACIANLCRTVAYGKELPFVIALNYRLPYNHIEPETAIIFTLPKDVFCGEKSVPIWGTNDTKQDYNYILPKYVYGLYHSMSDGANRRIIRNKYKPEEQATYKYIKFDVRSGRTGYLAAEECQEYK